VRPLFPALLLALLVGCPTDEPEPVPVEGDPPPGLVTELEITGVTINQAVEIPLMAAGEAVTDRAPVVAGREALVRIAVDAGLYWVDRDVRAELTLVGDETTVVDGVGHVAGPTDPQDRDSALEIRVPGELLTHGVEYRVELWELEWVEPYEEGSPAAWPPLGTVDLGVTEWGGEVKVEVLPIAYLADGSGRLPDISDEQMELLRSWLSRMYPTERIELNLSEVWETDIEFLSDGTGFGEVLEAMRDLREEREVPWDTYFYALIAPRESYEAFCGLGCTAGLSYLVANPNNARLKVSVGLGFVGEDTAMVMAHELGHAQNRRHAPCGGTSNNDPDYPYMGGDIGVVGWDSTTDELLDPDFHYDLMSYCRPYWISDYTWTALHGRTAAVEGLQDSHERSSERWQTLRVELDGGLHPGPVHEMAFTPEGEPLVVGLLDGRGGVLGEAEASFVSHGHGGGGVVIFREPAPEVRQVEVPGAGRVDLR